MKFWLETAAGFLSYVFIGWVFIVVYLAIQWFLRSTDVAVTYNWVREGTKIHPIFEVRNLSRSKTYVLANIAYSHGQDGFVWFDNKSLRGKELKPGSVQEFVKVSPIKNSSRISDCLDFRITVRLQSGRKAWMSDLADEQLQHAVSRLRALIEE